MQLNIMTVIITTVGLNHKIYGYNFEDKSKLVSMILVSVYICTAVPSYIYVN
jgi:ABC-type phosphate transport system permease subunit